MTLVNARPLRFSPAGLSDALAEEDAFPGACASLQNLIPDPSTKNVWTPRPASVSLTTFGSFTSPTNVTVCKIVGSYVFGMVSSGHYAGKDEPFCFNLLTNLFVTVSGVTSSNIPATQPTTGDWTPPTMDVVGTNLYVTHPGFDGVTNFVGWFDITNLAAPVWHAGNMLLINPIVTLSIAHAGSGYTNGTYTNVPLLGGTGAGATANITVSGGVVTAVTIANGGVGYLSGDALTVNNSLIGGGTGFSATVATVLGAGVGSVAILNTGVNYTDGVYTNVALLGGHGSGVQATVVVTGGSIVSAQVSAPGSGYILNDVLNAGGGILTLGSLAGGSGYTNGTYTNVPLSGGTGQGMTANITVSGGAVTSCTVNSAGSGYTVGDVLTLTGGVVTSFFMSNPGNGFVPNGVYTTDPNSSSAHGVNAIFTFVNNTGSPGYVTSVTMVTGGMDYVANEILYFNFGVTLTVLSATTVPRIGPGTGFQVAVASISSNPLGAGTGFAAQVNTLLNPGGYIKFTTIPSWVRQFNGRAWFGINPPTGLPSIIFTDVYAFNCTNANQALSFGDNTPLTAAASLGLANLLGGVIQSLIVFKSLNGIIQITGDATTNNLSVNQVPGGSGTLSPRSLCESPQGLLYLDHDGYRMVTLDGNCTDPIGVAGSGVTVPFINPITPTRVAAGCNGSVLRISVNAAIGGWQEYWFDLVRKVWSGPHTFPATMIDTYEGTFVLVAQAAPAALFESSPVPYASESFTENGTPMTWTFQTVVVSDNMQMAQSEAIETQFKASAPTGMGAVQVSYLDENAATIATMAYSFAVIPDALAARKPNFSGPVIYNRTAVQITGASVAGFRLGDVFVKARQLGYVQAVA